MFPLKSWRLKNTALPIKKPNENEATFSPHTAQGKPFRLVKYVAVSSLVVILISTVFLSGFLSHKARKILMQKSEQYAFLTAENLNSQVFYQFTAVTLAVEGEIRLSRKEQYRRLDRVVRNAIHGLAVESVNIYNTEGILTYSTEDAPLGEKKDLGEPFQKALSGEMFSVMEGRRLSFLGISWPIGPQKMRTYLPMWVELPLSWKRGRIIGVFEFTQDVTADQANIARFQVIIFGSVAVFVGVLFAALVTILRRAEGILEARARERRKLEEELHRAERLAVLGEMIAGVSHEIKNPLGIIRSTAELLEKRTEDPRRKKLAAIITEEATRLNNIVTEFLDFARPKDLRLEPCCVEDILERNLMVLEAECQKCNIRIERDYQTGGALTLADANLLYRAFMNLLVNAVQAMKSGGVLEIATSLKSFDSRREPILEVRINDTGPGIAAEVLPKIFNPFFTTREKGTGLGLSIVLSIVQGHQGTVELAPRPEGGTSAVVRLPLKAQDVSEVCA
ncbi:two-component system sensor histidine kinase NtrB [Desulfosoma caldarium]|uniref:histidine kinase n=1 Tax=Desulfosoma caldarium TaxID=610254 RepID=A0A3N1UKF9_9BACT|nr:ATP-binding protein [Desulfosoma caldarium]ROQ89869.1 phospho-acceptor domain-containing protein [Desulfosoma caldarium]